MILTENHPAQFVAKTFHVLGVRSALKTPYEIFKFGLFPRFCLDAVLDELDNNSICAQPPRLRHPPYLGGNARRKTQALPHCLRCNTHTLIMHQDGALSFVSIRSAWNYADFMPFARISLTMSRAIWMVLSVQSTSISFKVPAELFKVSATGTISPLWNHTHTNPDHRASRRKKSSAAKRGESNASPRTQP